MLANPEMLGKIIVNMNDHLEMIGPLERYSKRVADFNLVKPRELLVFCDEIAGSYQSGVRNNDGREQNGRFS